jgi:hypothetical protein
VASILNACAGGQETLERAATVEAINQVVRGSATAAAEGDQGPAAAVGTAQAEATISAVALQATQAALVPRAAQEATAQAFAPFQGILPLYEVDPDRGRAGWVHRPVTLEVTGYHQFDYANDFLRMVVTDFAVSADITWDTQYGTTGCGFVLRSDGNQEAYNQYLVIATRGASGHVLFGVMSGGEVVNWKDLYAYGLDPQFDWQNGATNRLAVVGEGQLFTIYTNGTKIGEIDPSNPPLQPILPPPPVKPPDNVDPALLTEYAKEVEEYQEVVSDIRSSYAARLRYNRNADKVFERGFAAMVALNESGTTRCEFNNAWLWIIE